MATYKLESGKVVDTSKAVHEIWESTYHDGSNTISQATGSQWAHEVLYCSKKGTWYTVHSSQWQGSTPYATELTTRQASEWVLLNGKDPTKYGLEDVSE